jgi:hypothetical protein
MRLDLERERLRAALLQDERPLVTAESRTFLPTTKGLLAVTPTRVLYTSKKWSWASDLRHITAVSLTQERARGTIRITSSKIEVFSLKLWDAQQVVKVIQAVLAARQ